MRRAATPAPAADGKRAKRGASARGDGVHGRSDEAPARAPPRAALGRGYDDRAGGSVAGILLLGTEVQVLQALLHFGPPSVVERRSPQQLMAVPCQLCGPDALVRAASEAFEPSVREFAQSLRPDVAVGMRDDYLQGALRELGEDLLLLEGYFCLASVSLPFGWADIDRAGADEAERAWRREACNQVDLLITASGPHTAGDASMACAAARALRESCRLAVADLLWQEEVQRGLRRCLGVGFPVSFTGADGAHVFVLLLPDDAAVSAYDGLLLFSGNPGVDYTAAIAPPPPQDLFADPAPQPLEQDLAAEPPLPEGWTRHVSRSTGRVYFHHAEAGVSTFDWPGGDTDWPAV